MQTKKVRTMLKIHRNVTSESRLVGGKKERQKTIEGLLPKIYLDLKFSQEQKQATKKRDPGNTNPGPKRTLFYEIYNKLKYKTQGKSQENQEFIIYKPIKHQIEDYMHKPINQ